MNHNNLKYKYSYFLKIIGRVHPPKVVLQSKLLCALALLICYRAGCFASGLAGACALAAAAVFCGSFQICLIDCYNVLQTEHLFHFYIAIFALFYYNILLRILQGVFEKITGGVIVNSTVEFTLRIYFFDILFAGFCQMLTKLQFCATINATKSYFSENTR